MNTAAGPTGGRLTAPGADPPDSRAHGSFSPRPRIVAREYHQAAHLADLSAAGDSVSLVAFALAATIVVADSGPNQAAHYALVRSLASGTAEIDPGETIDASYVDGKYYAAKAPGLALFTLPWYGGLRAAGLQHGQPATEAGYRHRLWALNLWGCPADARAAAPHGVRRRARRTRLRAASGCPARLRIPPAPVRDALLRPRPLGHLGFAAFVALLLARERDRSGSWLANGPGSPGSPSWPSSRSRSSPLSSGSAPRSGHGLLDG